MLTCRIPTVRPPRNGVQHATVYAMPVAMKRWISRRTGMDTMFTEFDHAARAAYEERTTRTTT